MANCVLATAVDTSRVGGRSRDWSALHLACESMLRRLTQGDVRTATVRTLLSVLDSQDRARRAGCAAVAAALWETCNRLACALAGRWSL